ncbi:MAG: tetratricopeptide repeat protein [Deltaproteobacteria bacterium]|jgi:tetratricopeptide (TPR) repeat protein|nr:tetratricopeptide repeat protein [Deltaproteobacteria bacterium]
MLDDSSYAEGRAPRARRLRLSLGEIIPAFFWVLFTILVSSGCAVIPGVTVIDDPLDKREHFELGLAYEKDGELELAIREYQAADPMPMAILGLGNAYFQQGDYKKAEAAYRRLSRESGDPAALNNLAFLLIIEGRNLEEAARLAERAVEEGIKRGLPEDQIRNFKSTYNQAQTALMKSGADDGGD